MKVIDQGFEILTPIHDGILENIEEIARVCYKSEDKIVPGSARRMVQSLVMNNHWAMLEHASISVKFTTDRGVSHELVRHRMASFAQESTRYCNYGKDKFGNELTFIKPHFAKEENYAAAMEVWAMSMADAERNYLHLIRMGLKPQDARSILPNSLKTEIVVTANLREWEHIFDLRCAPAAHPMMGQLMCPLRHKFQVLLPEVFGVAMMGSEEV